jgi:hypothetical protein
MGMMQSVEMPIHLEVFVGHNFSEPLNHAENLATLGEVRRLRRDGEMHRIGSGTLNSTRCCAKHGVLRAGSTGRILG